MTDVVVQSGSGAVYNLTLQPPPAYTVEVTTAWSGGGGGGGGVTTEDAVDAVAAALATPGANISVAYNDAANTITVAATGLVQNVLGVTGIWSGNQAAYDAIGSKVSTVLYIIV